MIAEIESVSFIGTETVSVHVQVQISKGMPSFNIVGLGDKAVTESRERIRSALNAVGLSLPSKRITVNLAPADLPKEGAHFDLPIAIGILSAAGLIPIEYIARFVALGELSLNGDIARVNGCLPAAIHANSQNKSLICPKSCGGEAAWAGDDFEIIAANCLLSLINHIKGLQTIERPTPTTLEQVDDLGDMSEIYGQEYAKRALEIAAAGGHNMLMIGPPGSGKSMMANRLISILPPLETSEMLETSIIASVAGLLKDGKISTRRPFRAPHHSASMAALVGGGIKPKPGEISLSHRGILFLDELPEFASKTLEALRQPLENGEILVSRANYHVNYPAKFQLIAAMNPCRCGMAGQPGHVCKTGARCVTDYQAKLSAPLLDRIDIHIEFDALNANQLYLAQKSEKSEVIAQRVLAARKIQKARFSKLQIEAITNSEISAKYMDQIAHFTQSGESLLIKATHKFALSARAYHRIIRLARTIADLDLKEIIDEKHVAEAFNYRPKFINSVI